VGVEERDAAIRLEAFAFLRRQARVYGDLLPRSVLQAGFQFDGVRVPLVGPQGIFKPAAVPELPLSITTAPPVEGREAPYQDEFRYGAPLTYRYRGTDPNHHENVGLVRAMERRVPLAYFYGIAPGLYAPIFPVYVAGADPRELAFAIDAADSSLFGQLPMLGESDAIRRGYVTRLVQQRLHQAAFRARVLHAYRVRCAVCELRAHPELLDAAHILPDDDPRGEPVVPNGLSMCKLHHAAFDANLLGIRPDHVIEVQRELLAEIDGPMLVHGLQGFDRRHIIVPRAVGLRPNPEFLEERYELFRKAG
jgi:putative restriction endonuclease